MELTITVLALTFLLFAGVAVGMRMSWLISSIIVGIPFTIIAVDYFIPGDQTFFRQVAYIVYAFLLYTAAIFIKKARGQK